MGKHTKKFYHPLFIFFIYLLVHASIRLFFDNALQVDDREQIFFGQTLEFGFPMPQPPLYSWLANMFFNVFGSSLFALTLLKYLIIFATFLAIWKVTEIYFIKTTYKNIVFFSYLLMPSFAWHMHQGFTHTILLGFSIIITLLALLKLLKKANTNQYVFFGFSVALGFMSKYSFILFILPLILSALTIKEFRFALLNKKIFISLAVLMILLLPHYLWLILNISEISSLANNKLNISILDNTSNNSLLTFLKSFIGFISPLIFTFFSLRFSELFHSNKGIFFLPSERLIIRFFGIILISLSLLLIFFSMPEIKVRWLHPLLMIFPFLAVLFIYRKSCLQKSFLTIFYSLVTLLSISIIGVRFAQNTIGPELGYSGRLNTPIIPTLRKIPQDILAEANIIKTNDFNIGAHILATFDKRFIAINDKFFNEDSPGNGGDCLFISDKPEIQNINKLSIDGDYSIYYKLISLGNCIEN